MRSLAASTTYAIPFSTTLAPDALPTAVAYADATSLGAMVVTAGSGTNDYSVAVVLPANVTTGQVITVTIDWAVDGVSQATATLLVGEVGYVTTIADASGTAAAAEVLVTPANKLATNASGQVEASNMRGTDGAYTGTPPTADEIRIAVNNPSTKPRSTIK